MLPDFLVLGAPRSATTSLHYYLQQHPAVAMSLTKEPNYFLFDNRGGTASPLIAEPRIVAKSVTDRAGYERLFPATNPGAIGEASPLYLYTAGTPALIAATLPEAKLIAVVREPVARAYSHFTYVNDGLGDRAPAAFVDAVKTELPLPDTPYRSGTHSLRLGRYAPQLQRYLDTFARDRLLVLSFADVQHRAATTMARVCRFLGVDATFSFDASQRYAPSGVAGRWSLDRALKPLRPHVKRMLPPRLAGRLARHRATAQAGHAGPSAAVPDEVRDLLADYYAVSNEWLKSEFNITFAG